MIKQVKTEEVVYSKELFKQLQPHMKASNNRRIIRGLFIESHIDKGIVEDISEDSQPVFTIKDDDWVREGKTYYSLKKIYFSYNHIPGYEYEFAKDVFNDWDHWNMLVNSGDYVREHIEAWREEMAILIQSKAFSSLTKVAMYEGSKGTPAAKFLADRGWEVKRGRPSKDEVTRERKIAAGVEKEVKEDMARLGLTLVSKG